MITIDIIDTRIISYKSWQTNFSRLIVVMLNTEFYNTHIKSKNFQNILQDYRV